MKYLFILIALLSCACGCTEDKRPWRSQAECYQDGGVEYQTGESGGSSHEVCIYRKTLTKGE